MNQPAIIAVKEERARIGDLQVTKETACIATQEGIVVIESHRIEQHQPPSNRPPPRQALPPVRYVQQPLPPPPTPVRYVQQPLPPPVRNVQKEYSWYDPRGKDCCVQVLLVLMWIVVASAILPLMILCFICFCIFDNDD